MIGICAEEAMELISAAIRRIGEREFTDQTRRSAKSTGVPITISIKSLLMELGITGETFMRNKASLKTEYENIARLLMDRNQKAEDYFIEGIAHIENGEQKLRTFDAVAESIIKSIPQNEQKLSDILLPIEPMSGLNRTEFGYEVADDSAKRQMFEASSSVSAKSFKIDLVFDESAVGKEHYDFSAENLPIASKRTVVIDGNTKEVVEYGIPTIKVTDDYMRRITSSMEDARARIKANKSIGVSTPEISRAIKADEILLRRESLRLLQMYREREKLSAFRHDFFENIKVDKGFRSSVEVFGTTGGRVIKARGKDESGWGQMKLTTAFGKKADKVELFHVSMASNQFVSVDESGTNVAGAPSFEVGKVYTRIQYNDQSGEKRFMYIPLQTGTLTDNRDVDNTINFLLGSLVGRQNPEALKLVLDTVFVTGHDYRPIKMDKAYKSEDTGIKYCNTTLDEVASLVESGILGSTEWSNGMYDENLMTQTIRASKEGGRVSITWRDSSTTTRKPKGSAGVFKTMEIVPRSDASGTIYEVSVFNHFDMRTDFGDGTKLSDSQMSSIVSTPVGVITDGTVVKGSLFEKKSVEMTEVELEQLLLNHGMWKDMKRNINWNSFGKSARHGDRIGKDLSVDRVGKEYGSYKEMLVETFGLTTDVGSVRDAKGKILTHFEDSPESRMKLLVKKMRVSRAKKPDSIETAPIVEAGKTVKDPKDDQESLLRDVEDIFRTKPFEEDSRHLGNSIESDEEVIEEIDRLLGDEDLVSFHEGIIKKKGRKLWGYMANGMIHLSQGANKKVLRHEVFHLIFWSLDAKTREKILKEAKAMFKIGEDELSSQMKMSGVELDEAREILLEERLADMYEDVSVKYYRRPSFIPESVWTFFENLITTIRSMLGNKRA